jgi:hypothetical protein
LSSRSVPQLPFSAMRKRPGATSVVLLTLVKLALGQGEPKRRVLWATRR